MTSQPGTASEVGQEAHDLMARLYPICRSITGDGVRATLRILQEYIPLQIREVPTGAKVFDWTVPREWNIRNAYVKDSLGNKVIDFQRSNLHILGYSTPIHATVSLEELKKHLYTLPEHPDWIPYRTSYFKENWGFCLPHNQLIALEEGNYEVFIDSSLSDGHLTYGEFFIDGESDDEILLSTHVCHPSLANDNLAGLALASLLARSLEGRKSRYSYRFLFTPGMIGSITWLSLNEEHLERIKHGLILACLGDPGPMTYKKSRRENAEIDRAVAQVLKDSGQLHRTVEFSPFGYDERQFCSPGINLPVGCLMRTSYGEFSEYHTSADNLEFVQPRHLADSFHKLEKILHILEANRKYRNLNPKCEPQLGRRGLYGAIGGNTHGRNYEIAMLWVLNYSDGTHDLLDISTKSGLAFDVIKDAAGRLYDHDLLEGID